MNSFLKGSEWRRWDLHLHTPFTKKEDNYHGTTPEEKWDNFYHAIDKYVGNGSDPMKAICAIAITDYLSIDNYFTVRDNNRLPACVKLLLPNVELRMIPVAQDSPINIHCIFSPYIADEIEDRFFAKLEFEYSGNKYSATRSQLISLGRAYTGDATLSEEGCLHTALTQYVISSETLSNVFKNDPELKENAIIAVSNKSSDGASGTRTHSAYFDGTVSQLDATRRSIYQLSDMIFSANPSDISYFLGEAVDSAETVKRKCNSLMPCVHGCDAHTNDRIFEPDNQRYCWIKADPTFEGLKQILYEPKERVRISAIYPEEKEKYHVIDHVEIVGNPDFCPQPIYFSDKLTSIIGGKSTGKSLLLHNMALAIDKAQVKEKDITAATNVKPVSELKVYWCDGVCSDEEERQRKIVYIPQAYLNRLSDEREETTEIDTIIQDIILQNETIAQLYAKMNENIGIYKQSIAKTVVDFLCVVSDCNALEARKKEIGDEVSITQEIESLTNRLTQLSEKYNVTEDEVKAYQTAMEKIQQFAAELLLLEKERKSVNDLESVLQKKSIPYKDFPHFSEKLPEVIEKIQIAADSQWQTERNLIISEIDTIIDNAKKSLAEYQRTVSSLKPKMDGNEQIAKMSASILAEREKLGKISEIDKALLDSVYTS